MLTAFGLQHRAPALCLFRQRLRRRRSQADHLLIAMRRELGDDVVDLDYWEAHGA